MNEKVWQLMMGRVSQIGACLDDDGETRLQKVILVVTAALISTAGLLWGLFYWLAGEPLAALIPFGYSVLSVINLYLFNRTLRFEIFRFFQILLTLLLPVSVMLVLGG